MRLQNDYSSKYSPKFGMAIQFNRKAIEELPDFMPKNAESLRLPCSKNALINALTKITQ